MFLSKKNAAHFNKAKKQHKNRKPLGGWEDGSDNQKDKQDKYQQQQTVQQQKPVVNLNILQGFQDIKKPTYIPQKIQKKTQHKDKDKEKLYYDWDALDSKQGIQCEKKIVEQIVQPGGIRIKPNQNMLIQFLKQCKSMDLPIIGSLLLSKIEVNYPFQVKAKALYTIQYIVKKNQKYAAYFKYHCSKLEEFPQPEDNIQNYRKTLKNVITTIGGSSVTKNNYAPQGDILQFVDHGEYNNKKNDPISFIKTHQKKAENKNQVNKKQFISPNDAKKPKPVGPQMKGSSSNTNSDKNNSKNTNNVLDLDLFVSDSNDNNQNNNQNNEIDLLGDELSKKQNKIQQKKEVSFDDLLSGMGNSNNNNQLV